jgi:C1A family cysteine protease
MRKDIYSKNQLLVDFQSKNASSSIGINELSDWTDDEIERLFNGIDHDEEEELYEQTEEFHINDVARDHPMVMSGRMNDTVDWRKHNGVITGVKMQGSCGSCWAFTSAGVLEGAIAIVSGNMYEVSEQ